MLHGLPIGLTAHDDADFDGLAVGDNGFWWLSVHGLPFVFKKAYYNKILA